MLLQDRQDERSFPVSTPAVISLGHARPWSKAWWDLASGRASPHDPENGFDDQAGLAYLPSRLKPVLWQKQANLLPVDIGHLRHSFQSDGRNKYSFIQAARLVGRKSDDAVAYLIACLNAEGLSLSKLATGGGPPICYSAVGCERILGEFRRPPDRRLDGTATWSLTTLQRTLR